MLPVWQRAVQKHIDSGALAVVGVVQDQHADRVALYKQWRELDWPIFVDALNVLGHEVVPIAMGINASGLVVIPRMRLEMLDVFLQKDFARREHAKAPPPLAHAGDALFHAGKWDDAIAAYEKDDAPHCRFRLGVALRRRFESDARQPGDGQRAVAAWTDALAARPSQYIWRRRIQQYGPRLHKPYNMFGWIEQARRDIVARGDTPVALAVEPRGSELLDRGPAPAIQIVDLDPNGKIERDKGLVALEAIAAPPRVRPGQRVRIRLVFRVDGALWNNESDPIALHATAPTGWTLVEGVFAHPVPKKVETAEVRTLELELQAPTAPGKATVRGYALYYVCEKAGGVCRYLRHDFAVPVTVDPKAPKIQ